MIALYFMYVFNAGVMAANLGPYIGTLESCQYNVVDQIPAVAERLKVSASGMTYECIELPAPDLPSIKAQ